jgi:hypothetical protein
MYGNDIWLRATQKKTFHTGVPFQYERREFGIGVSIILLFSTLGSVSCLLNRVLLSFCNAKGGCNLLQIFSYQFCIFLHLLFHSFFVLYCCFDDVRGTVDSRCSWFGFRVLYSLLENSQAISPESEISSGIWNVVASVIEWFNYRISDWWRMLFRHFMLLLYIICDNDFR